MEIFQDLSDSDLDGGGWTEASLLQAVPAAAASLGWETDFFMLKKKRDWTHWISLKNTCSGQTYSSHRCDICTDVKAKEKEKNKHQYPGPHHFLHWGLKTRTGETRELLKAIPIWCTEKGCYP